ncbi:aldehyde dehydrogenase [Acrocarpospora macrocephala]|uniref:Carnitine dehydratase n=1 Tax=Acrocarpospora macrocephala TaxID=150177 RepID=A0A5M3X004_9ACTN|nr:aldehyde dehydrogenase family protein [Acrocarpospora macrocephala]GES12921.1 carnitine dehydratase [Acrocarpospora macrocephala]
MSTLAGHIATARLPAAHSFVSGALCHGGGREFATSHPGDGTWLATVQEATPQFADAAVREAAAAQPAWAATSPHQRARVLRAAADLIEAQSVRLAHLVTLDNGKTLAEAYGEVAVAAAHLRAAAGWAATLEGSTLPADGGTLRMTFREPVGVVAAIIPFNTTLVFAAQKAGPALAAGNAVLLKAPEVSPLAAPVFAGLLTDAGLPPGLLQVLQGAGEVGRRLAEHPAVTMVSFTGSTAVGRQVMRSAADGMKRVLLELGGKSANIVYADAALDAALHATVGGIFRNAGQRCFSGSRLLVEEPVADEFTARVVELARSIRVGPPFDPDSQLGTLISAAEATRVHVMVQEAVEQGAKVLAGGEPPDGAFYAPTVLEVAPVNPPDIVYQEVFGPVLTVQRFSGAEQAVALANDSPFGLVGGCWTRDLDRALTTARRVRSGYFWINSYGALALDAPIGGVGLSGVGRELGRLGHEAYTETKTVIIDTASADAPRWY